MLNYNWPNSKCHISNAHFKIKCHNLQTSTPRAGDQPDITLGHKKYGTTSGLKIWVDHGPPTHSPGENLQGNAHDMLTWDSLTTSHYPIVIDKSIYNKMNIYKNSCLGFFSGNTLDETTWQLGKTKVWQERMKISKHPWVNTNSFLAFLPLAFQWMLILQNNINLKPKREFQTEWLSRKIPSWKNLMRAYFQFHHVHDGVRHLFTKNSFKIP